MKKRVYIISHSSMDLVSVLSIYERCKNDCEVTIIISGTSENLQFLQHVNIPASALRFLKFASVSNTNKKQLVRYMHQLISERRLLDELIGEIKGGVDNELYFHSYDNDPHAGYLVSRVAETNRVILVDVLGIRPRPLRMFELLTPIGLKNLGYLAIVSFVYGRLFMLSGTRSAPLLSLNLSRVKIADELRNVGKPTGHQVAYRFPASGTAKNAVLLYANSYGVPEPHHASIYRMALDCLANMGLNVYVKMHPQSRRPDYFDDYNVRYIPHYIPFEFVDLTNVSLVVGLAGASLLCTGDTPTISLLKLLYPSDSDLYASALAQTGQNPAIVYVSSSDELKNFVAALA